MSDLKVKVTGAGTVKTKNVPFGLKLNKVDGAGGLPMMGTWVDVEVTDGTGKTKRARGFADGLHMKGWMDPQGENFDEATAQADRSGIESLPKFYNGEKTFLPFSDSKERAEYFRQMAKEFGTTELAMQDVYSRHERAVIDAVARSLGLNATDLLLNYSDDWVKQNDEFKNGVPLTRILRASSQFPSHIKFRHTIGLDDAICREDLATTDREEGKFSVEEDIERLKVNCLKMKIDARIDRNIQRLKQLAEVLNRKKDIVGNDFVITLDGNEAFGNWDDLVKFAEAFSSEPTLAELKKHTKYIEQPFARALLADIGDDGRAAVKKLKEQYGLSLMIDEAGGNYQSAEHALNQGIDFIGQKPTCKGFIHGVHDAGLVLARNGSGCAQEDLTINGPHNFNHGMHSAAAQKLITGPDSHNFGVESNGPFRTTGFPYTERQTQLYGTDMPNLYYVQGGQLKTITPTNNRGYSTDAMNLKGPGLGGAPNVHFDPEEENENIQEVIARV